MQVLLLNLRLGLAPPWQRSSVQLQGFKLLPYRDLCISFIQLLSSTGSVFLHCSLVANKIFLGCVHVCMPYGNLNPGYLPTAGDFCCGNHSWGIIPTAHWTCLHTVHGLSGSPLQHVFSHRYWGWEDVAIGLHHSMDARLYKHFHGYWQHYWGEGGLYQQGVAWAFVSLPPTSCWTGFG